MSNPPSTRIEKRDIVSEREAWFLFKFTAIGEAFSWLLLLIGMLIKYLVPSNGTWVAVGGSIHGMVFLAYFVVVVWLWKVLRFNSATIFTALLVSVVPFGTLLLEQVLSSKRDRQALSSFRQIVVRALIPHGTQVLAIQPQDRPFWCLPGGVVLANEQPEEALIRTVSRQTGITPTLGKVQFLSQYNHHQTERLELFFLVPNAQEYIGAEFSQVLQDNPELEEVAFVPLDGSVDLKPDLTSKYVPSPKVHLAQAGKTTPKR